MAAATSSVLRGESYPQRLKDFISIHRFLDNALATQTELSEKEALRQCADGVSINFRTLQQKANELAARLSRVIRWPQSIDADRIVAVCLPPSIDLVVGLLAIFKLGAAYLPIDVSFPPDRVAHIINDAQPAILLSKGSILLASNVLSETPNLSIFDIDQQKNEDDDDDATLDFQSDQAEMPDLLAAVLYTSGSTGIPKGVRLEHRTILHRLNWQWRVFPYGEAEGPACFKTALTFVDSIAEIWAPLLMGVPLLIVPKDMTTNTECFISLLDRCGVSRLVLVPSLLKAMLSLITSRSQLNENRKPDKDSGTMLLSRLKMWVCSGEILTADLLLDFYYYFPTGTIICNYYGSTEVMGDVTYALFQSHQEVVDALVENKVPIGKPLDNCSIYLLDSNTQQLVAEGDVGEIYVAGSHICSGYVNQREMQRFVVNPIDKQNKTFRIMFRTGDFGRIVNGQLYYEGRSDSQVKVRGHRIDLNEVNLVVSRLDGISACIVLCYKAGEPEQEVVAFIIPREGFSIDDIKQRLKGKLVSYMLPQVVEVSELPLLVNGKIDRQKLFRLFEDQKRDTDKNISLCDASLLSPEKKALLKTVISVVGSSIGRAVELTDNFFDVGGNSLNAVAVVTKLRDQGYDLDMATFLLSERLEELVPRLKNKQSSCDRTPTTDVYSTEMLSDAVKQEVIKMISTSFSEKAELELLTGVTYQDYDEFMNELWEPLVAANLSFTVKDKAGTVVGVALNFDVFDEPVVEPKVKRLAYVFEFLESLEAPVREQHFEKKKNFLLHSFMMGTRETAAAAENVFLIQRMEKEILEIAKSRGFSGVFTTNTNELTRQICDDLMDYKVLSEFQVREFVASDGTRPFSNAPETQYSAVTVKFFV